LDWRSGLSAALATLKMAAIFGFPRRHEAVEEGFRTGS
jgi:hypothetical protein